jgi:hypothetical protein
MMPALHKRTQLRGITLPRTPVNEGKGQGGEQPGQHS